MGLLQQLPVPAPTWTCLQWMLSLMSCPDSCHSSHDSNDFCSALALDACCMQRPMKRKVCWSDFSYSALVIGPFVCVAAVNSSNCVNVSVIWGRASVWVCLCWAGDVGGDGAADSDLLNRVSQPPLLISASSLSCMNVSCQGRREIKMVVCISCWVAVVMPAFSSRLVCLFLFSFFSFLSVWGSR